MFPLTSKLFCSPQAIATVRCCTASLARAKLWPMLLTQAHVERGVLVRRHIGNGTGCPQILGLPGRMQSLLSTEAKDSEPEVVLERGETREGKSMEPAAALCFVKMTVSGSLGGHRGQICSRGVRGTVLCSMGGVVITMCCRVNGL